MQKFDEALAILYMNQPVSLMVILSTLKLLTSCIPMVLWGQAHQWVLQNFFLLILEQGGVFPWIPEFALPQE